MNNNDVLKHVRVLELDGGIPTSYAGRLLADLGARVTKVETGDSLLGRGLHTVASGPRVTPGALYDALNAGKGRLAVEPVPASRAEFLLGLAEDVDIVLAGRATLADDLIEGLRTRNPALAVGLASMCGEREGDDRWMHLHAAAISGVTNIIGQRDRPPLPPPYELGSYVAGANLGAAVLSAHFSVIRGGPVPVVHVDVAGMLFSFMWTAQQLSRMSGEPFTRSGRRFPGSGGAYPFALFPCADGYVACIGRSADDWQALLTMMGHPSWADDERFQDPRSIARNCPDEADLHVIAWLRQHTRADLFERAQAVGFPLAPVKRVSEVLAEEQFLARGSFGTPLTAVGRKVHLLRHPFHFERPSSHTGASNVTADDHGDVGRSADDRGHDPLAAAVHVTGGGHDGLFSGLRVLDLSWVWSGPLVSAALADLGADVIKLENPRRLDNARLRGRPVKDGRPVDGPVEELSTYFHQNNRGKRSVLLDIKDPAGVDVFRRLVRTSDVVIENLTPGVFDRAGIGYPDVRDENPGLIWLAASAVGASGPLVGLRAYAPIMSSLAGIEGLVGYDDDPVVGMLGCGIGDANAGSHALLAVLAALVSRQQHGRGTYIDMSQIEAAVSILVEPLVEAQVQDVADPGPSGTWHPAAAPHGHYPCAGNDVWVAIAAVDDASWRALATAVGGRELADNPSYETVAGRMDRSDEIDKLLGAWTSQRSRESILTSMATHGVPAAPVLAVHEAEDLFGSHLQDVPHPWTGSESIVKVPWSLSESGAQIRHTAPLVGEHTEEVLRDVVGMAEDERQRYIASFRGENAAAKPTPK